ncbi:hypothetical protein ACVWZZ_005315 [Bradyrhizobium sp. LM6.10]|jgi:hypothetical protein
MAAAELSKVTFGSKFAFRDLRAIIVSRISFLFQTFTNYGGVRSDPLPRAGRRWKNKARVLP